MSYLRAVLNADTTNERKYLKELIKTGSKLKYNTKKYKKELYKLDNKKFSQVKKTKIIKKVYKKSNSKYTINDVYVQDNSIIVDFNTYVTSKHLKYFELHYKKLSKDIFDIKGNFRNAAPTKLTIKGVDKISISQYKKNTLRIVISNKKNLKTIYMLNKKRIIIKVLNLNKSNNIKKTKISKIIRKKYYKKRNKIVVIDAGHGGKDSGAVGPYKRYEKNVVLSIAKKVYKNLKADGYTVYITRSKDRFIKVKNRTILANKKKADIFISIHANAAAKKRAKKMHGIETFFLSPARSERAKRVAAKENRSDMRKMDYSTKSSFLTILNRPKITASQKLAIDVQKNILYKLRKTYKNVNDSGVREGPFWVLVGAQMPSILIEIGYISHPMESRRLVNPTYQKHIAYGITQGINSYFAKNP